MKIKILVAALFAWNILLTGNAIVLYRSQVEVAANGQEVKANTNGAVAAEKEDSAAIDQLKLAVMMLKHDTDEATSQIGDIGLLALQDHKYVAAHSGD